MIGFYAYLVLVSALFSVCMSIILRRVIQPPHFGQVLFAPHKMLFYMVKRVAIRLPFVLVLFWLIGKYLPLPGWYWVYLVTVLIVGYLFGKWRERILEWIMMKYKT